MKGMIHTCTLRGRRQNFTLGYDTGTAAFTAGKTLTGATSHATAIIVSVTGTTAAGTITLHTITGTFQDDEVLSDNGTVPGAAVVNSTITEKFNDYGELVFTDIDTTVSACKFYKRKVTMKSSGQAIVLTSSNRLMLPSTVTPVAEDEVITTATGFEGTWIIGSPAALPGPGVLIGHWECDIAKAGA